MKKTLHYLITNTAWSKVEIFIEKNYPGEELSFYKQLYWKLFNTKPLKNDANITMHLDIFGDNTPEIFGSNEELYYEVETYNEIKDEEWALYLGFYIETEVLKNHPYEEIICHMLFEFLYGEIEFLIN